MASRAITYGTFDILHYGHMRLLERIGNMADEVFVGLASDEIVLLGKKTRPFYEYAIRREMLLHTRHVDHVICNNGPVDASGRVMIVQSKISFIKEHRIDLVVMGEDWRGEYDFLSGYCEVRYLSRTPGISTTFIRAGRPPVSARGSGLRHQDG